MRIVFAFVSILALAACDESPKRSGANSDNANLEQSAPKVYDPEEEGLSEELSFFDRGRDDAREAARAYVLTTLPGAQVHGMATLSVTGNLYLIGVDLVSGGQGQEIDLIARRYFDDVGGSYWKAQPLTADLARALAGYETRALQQKAQDAISGQE